MESDAQIEKGTLGEGRCRPGSQVGEVATSSARIEFAGAEMAESAAMFEMVEKRLFQ